MIIYPEAKFAGEGEAYDFAMQTMNNGDFMECYIGEDDTEGAYSLSAVYMHNGYPCIIEGGSKKYMQLHRIISVDTIRELRGIMKSIATKAGV